MDGWIEIRKTRKNKKNERRKDIKKEREKKKQLTIDAEEGSIWASRRYL